MNARWYRSRLFWSGLAGLVILVVSWGASYRMAAGVSGEAPGWIGVIGKTPQSIFIFRLSYDTPGKRPIFPAAPRVGFFSRPGVPQYPGVFFVPVVEIEKSGNGRGIFIGIWAAITAYFFLWTGVLVWWQRRKHRLMKLSLPETPAGLQPGSHVDR